ncbi:MAG: universal stress protein [Betaproteobacteria bacterium]|nr:universal stress protein [Betaproteobacteria bacterium]
MYSRILVPTDGSDITHKAVEAAINLARRLNAQLFAISVKDPFPYSAISEVQPIAPQEFYEDQEKLARQRVTAVVDAAHEQQVACSGYTVESLHPWQAILDHAKSKNCDLIVMASHGRRGVAALLLGSETQRVLLHSAVAVLVVK